MLHEFLLKADGDFPVGIVSGIGGYKVVLVCEESAAEIEDRVRSSIAHASSSISDKCCLTLIFENRYLRRRLEARVVATGSCGCLELNLKVKGQAALAALVAGAVVCEVEGSEEHIERLLDVFLFQFEGERGVLKLSGAT